MLTLFTKSPLPAKSNSVLLNKFGYPSARGNKKKELHTTVKASNFNKLKGKKGFGIRIRDDCVQLISNKSAVLGYWDRATLKKRFDAKYPGLLYVKADARGKGNQEEFWFKEAFFLWGFDFNKFVDLLKEDVILVDVRIGQYSNGRPHDHGTGFRVMPDQLDRCFKHREKVV